MFLKLLEVYDEVNHGANATGTKAFMLRDIVINEDAVSFMRDDTAMTLNAKSGRLPKEFAEENFTRITISKGNMGQDITVIGCLDHIASLLENFSSKKKTLKG